MGKQQVCQLCNCQFESKKNKKFCTQKCYFDSKKKPEIEIKCGWCRQSFCVAYRHRAALYCSKACSNSATKRNRITKICLQCSKEFEVISFRSDVKFCSHDCKHTNMRNGNDPTIILECENCKKEFEVDFIHRNKRYCSRKCSNGGKHNGMYGNKVGAKKISKAISLAYINDTRNFQKGYKSGYFESGKTAVKQFYRSSYELRALQKLDADKNVVSIQTEVLRIPYNIDGSEHIYIPDILVVLTNGEQKVIEIKASYMRDDPTVEIKVQTATEFCERIGMSYEIWDEKTLV